MLRIGLTGSIAVGKSFVLSIFKELGCAVLDADFTAREVVKPGTEGLDRIVASFGEEILTGDGELDRKKLGRLVFADDSQRQLLNSIVHPLVIDAQDKWLAKMTIAQPNGVAIIDAALMIETGSYTRFDKIIVVWCDDAVQLKRLMSREGMNVEMAKGRIGAQLSQREKKSFADFLIDTSEGFDETRRQTKRVFAEMKKQIG